MSERVSDQVIQLDTESWRTLNQTVRRLESAWLDGRPDLSGFAPDDSDPLRTAILLQLIKVDQELSWETVERRLLESYLAEWPELAANSDALTELLAAECLNRALADAPPDAAELQRRFPDVADRIDLQLIVRQAQNDGKRPDRSDDVKAEESGGDGHREPTPGTDSATGLLPGNRFGRYEIRERIGHGSMGAVYRAWDTRLRREVALKIPHFDDTADAKLIERFREEAVAMAQVHHSAVCPVFDAFELDGTFALTMACVDGRHLGDLMEQRRIDQQQAAQLLLTLTRGVDAIHERGVIHRDIKPANVVVNRHGEPVLTDFGLARTAADKQTSGGSTELSGTPAYMSPEQISGLGKVDERSDVYSLGVLLFQMLTGSLPFTGDLSSVLDAVCHESPPKPSSLRPAINRTLELICLKALEKQPDDRFESAQEMAQSLESCISTMRQERQKRRRRVMTAVGTALIAVLTIVVVYLVGEPPKSDEDIMLLARPTAEYRIPGSDSAHRAVVPADGSQLIVSSRYDGYAPFRFYDLDTGQDGQQLQFSTPDEFYGDAEQPRHDHMGAVRSHDGRYLFCNDYYAKCLVRIDLESPRPDESVEFLPIGFRWAQTLSLSPDGTRLVTATGQSGRPTEGHDNTLVIVNVEGGAFKKLAEVHIQNSGQEPSVSEEIVGTHFGFRGDSQSVFALTGRFTGSDSKLVEISLQKPYGVIAQTTFPGARIHDLAIASRNELILLSDEVNRTLRIVSLNTLKDTGRTYSVYGHVPGPLKLSGDEETLYVLCPEARRLVCLDPMTGEVIGGAHGLPGDGKQLHLSSDDSQIWTVHPESVVAQCDVADLLHRIVFASNPDGPHQIHVMTVGGSVQKLSEGTHTERCPRWSPDGRRIAFISNRKGQDRICVMNRAGDGIRVLKQTDPVIGWQHQVPLGWSPDGKEIAFIGANHKAIRVVDVDSGSVRTILNGPAIPLPNHVYDHHNGLTWSRPGNAIFFNSQVESYGHDQDILRLNPQTGEVTAVTGLWGRRTYFVAPTVSSVGRVSAIRIDPGPPTTWQLCNVSTTSVRFFIEPTPEELRSPVWFPDDTRLLYASGSPGRQQLQVLDVVDGTHVALKSVGPDSGEADVWRAGESK